MSVEKVAVVGFGVRVNLTPEIFKEESTLPFREHIWDALSENEKEYYPKGIKDFFSEDYFDVDAFSNKFSELRFEWCGNAYYPSVPKVDERFVFVKSTYVRLRDSAQWVDLSKRTQVSPEAFQQLALFDSLLLEEKTPRWYVFNATV